MFVVRVHVGPQINYPDGEMVDTQVLGTCDVSRVGSSPTWGTIDVLNIQNKLIFSRFELLIISFSEDSINYKIPNITPFVVWSDCE